MSKCDMKIYILAYPLTFTIAIVICPNVDRKFESFFKRFYGLLMNLARWNYHQLLDVYYIYKSRLFAYSSRKREATVYEEIVKVVSSDTNRLFAEIHLAPSGLFINTWNVSGVLFYFFIYFYTTFTYFIPCVNGLSYFCRIAYRTILFHHLIEHVKPFFIFDGFYYLFRNPLLRQCYMFFINWYTRQGAFISLRFISFLCNTF